MFIRIITILLGLQYLFGHAVDSVRTAAQGDLPQRYQIFNVKKVEQCLLRLRFPVDLTIPQPVDQILRFYIHQLHLVGAVKNGYLRAGGDAEKLFVLPTLEAAKKKLSSLLQQGDAVLFLNDLPDVY